MHRFFIILLSVCAVSLVFSEEFFHCRSVDDVILNCELDKKFVPQDSLWTIQKRVPNLYDKNITCFNTSNFCSFNTTSVTFNSHLQWPIWYGFRLYHGTYIQDFDCKHVSFPYPPRVEISKIGQDFANISIANYTSKESWSYFIISDGRRFKCNKWCILKNLECGRPYEVCGFAKYNRMSKSECANIKFQTEDCQAVTSFYSTVGWWVAVSLCCSIFAGVVIVAVFKYGPSLSKLIRKTFPRTNSVPQSPPIPNNSGYEPMPDSLVNLIKKWKSPPDLPPRNPSRTSSSSRKESDNTVAYSEISSVIQINGVPPTDSNAEVYDVERINSRNFNL